METSIKERIKQFVEQTDMSMRKFEQLSGLSNGFVKNANSIGSAAVEKIHRAFPELSMEWLLFNEGDMLITDAVTNTASHVSGGVVVQGQKNFQQSETDRLLDEMRAQRELYATQLDRSQTQITELLKQNSSLINILTLQK